MPDTEDLTEHTTRKRKARTPKARAPRTVKPREYSVFKILKTVDPPALADGVNDAMPVITIQEFSLHPTKADARKWIKDNAKDGEQFMCACVLFVARIVMKPELSFE